MAGDSLPRLTLPGGAYCRVRAGRMEDSLTETRDLWDLFY